MELRHIRYFVRAAELLHFTHAAESLYISQPTLSTHMHQLEEELGIPLFDRTARNVTLTEAGSIFLEHALSALHNLDLAQQSIADLKNLVHGKIRLGALLTFGQEVLPSWIASFHDRYPEIRIEVQTGTSDSIEADLQAGNIDLALAFVPASAEYLHGVKLFDEEIFLVVSEQHPLAKRKEIKPAEIANVPLAVVSRRWSARRIFDSFVAEYHITPNVLIEIDDLHALLRIASAGHAAAVLARFAVANHPNLRLIPIVGAPLRVAYGVLWHSQIHLSPPAQAFLDHIREECAKTPTVTV